MKTGQRGFTLVELLVTLAIVAIVGGSLVKMFGSMAIGHTTRTAGADLQQSVRAVLDLMGRELRMAGFSSLRPAGFGIDSARQQEVIFTVDWDDDGYVTQSHATNPDIRAASDSIAYRFDGAGHRLVRVTAVGTDSESTQTIIGGPDDPMRVVDLRFSYFDRQGDITSRIQDISSVEVALTADLPAGIRGRQTRLYRTRIKCRNLQL